MTLLKNFERLPESQAYPASNTLRIAIVTETWPPEINGVARSVMQLCKGLQQRGHQILLVRPQQPTSCEEFSPDAECRVTASRIPKYPELRFGHPQRGKIAKAFKQFKPDIVHIVTEGPLGLAALHLARQQHYPVSSGFHSPFHEFSRFFDLKLLIKPVQYYLRWFHNQTDLTCVPSADTRQALLDFGVSCPMALVGRGVDTELFSPTQRSESLRTQWNADADTTVMLYVGRLSPEKNIDQVIRAYQHSQASQPNRRFKLVIVGDGPDRQRLTALAPDAVFCGVQTGVALSQHYASADVFVFASEVETFGNVVLEALASGLPVLAYDYACAALTIHPEKNGWHCVLNQPAQFLTLAEQLPPLSSLQQMQQVAITTAQQFGWSLAVSQFEQALKMTAEKHYTLYSTAWNRAMIPLFIT